MQALALRHGKPQSTRVEIHGNTRRVFYHGLLIAVLWNHEGVYRLDDGQLSADCGGCEECRVSSCALQHPKVRRYAQQLYGVALPPHCRVTSEHTMAGEIYRFSANDHAVLAVSIPTCCHWQDDQLVYMGAPVLTVGDAVTFHAEQRMELDARDVTLDPRVALHRALLTAFVARLRANQPRPRRSPLADEAPILMFYPFSLDPLERLLEKAPQQ
jgi:hypothetical protein